MSTNFYLKVEPIVTVFGDTISYDDTDPNVHVGVRRGDAFIWAQNPERLKEYGEANPESKFIANEYGEGFTWSEFACDISGLSKDQSMIGKRFF